jgi:hypothetical protein
MSHDVPSSMALDHEMHYEDKSNVITSSEPPEHTKPNGLDEICKNTYINFTNELKTTDLPHPIFQKKKK